MKAERAVKGLVGGREGHRVRGSMTSRQGQSWPWQLGKGKGTGSAEQPGLSRQNQIKEATGFHNPGSGLSKRNKRWGKEGLESPFQRPSTRNHVPALMRPVRKHSWALRSCLSPTAGDAPQLYSPQDWHLIPWPGLLLHPSFTLHRPTTARELSSSDFPGLCYSSLLSLGGHPLSCHHPGSSPSQSSHHVEPPWFPLPLDLSPDLGLAFRAPHTLALSCSPPRFPFWTLCTSLSSPYGLAHAVPTARRPS